MKKIFAILIIVGMLVGCAGTSFLCKNGPTISAGLQLVIDQANSVIATIQTSYPGVIPPVAQEIIDKAQTVKDAATLALNKVCPTATDLTEVQAQMTQTMTLVKASVKARVLKLGR